MEFREYSNPEAADYDITSSLKESTSTSTNQVDREKYIRQLIDLVGFLEDGEIEYYGLTEEEYMNPTSATIAKVQAKLESLGQEPLVRSK